MELGKIQMKLYKMTLNTALKRMASSVKRKRWHYCIRFGNKGQFLSRSKHLDKEYKYFFPCISKFLALFPMKFNAFHSTVALRCGCILGLMFKKKWVKYLACLIGSIIFPHISLFSPSILVFSIRKGYFEFLSVCV